MAEKEPIPNSWEGPEHIPQNPTYDTPLILLGLPPKLYAYLSEAGYDTLGRLMHAYNSNPDVLIQISGVGPAALETIHAALAPFITLNDEEFSLPAPAPGLEDDSDWTRLPKTQSDLEETPTLITPPTIVPPPLEDNMTIETPPEEVQPIIEQTDAPAGEPPPDLTPEPIQDVQAAEPAPEMLPEEPELPEIEIPAPIGVPPTPDIPSEPKKKKKKVKKMTKKKKPKVKKKDKKKNAKRKTAKKKKAKKKSAEKKRKKKKK